MQINDNIYRELVKRGHSLRKKTRVWDISDSRLWYLTPELAKGFLKFAKYEPYRKVVIEREVMLLEGNAKIIAEKFGDDKFNLIDLGCGGGLKTSIFINNLPNNVSFRYCPVDMNSYFIDKCVKVIESLKSKKVKSVKSFVSDFNDLSGIVGTLRNGTYSKNLILLLGETISHYDVNDFLFQLSNSMLSGDMIVIGNGYRVGERFTHIEKYKDPLFHQWFVHILYGLGLKDNEMKYNARFENGRLEFYYTVLVDKELNHGNKNVFLKKGDEIIVGIQYKYYEHEWIKFCKMYFSQVDFIADREGEYSLMVCKK